MQSGGGTVEVSLLKPLGLGLEEVQAGKPGVRVQDVKAGGSAIKAGTVTEGMVLLKLNGKDCTKLDFDAVMQLLIDAPDAQPIRLVLSAPAAAAPAPPRKTGPMELTIVGPKESGRVVRAKAGDNLRKALLGAKVQVYAGAAVLTNCSGAGQCGTCVVKVQGEGWSPRSDWEAGKLKGRPASHRLACQTTVEGDATVTVQPAKNA